MEQVNERGIKLGGRWWNFSRYHAVTPPARGQSVALLVKGDFISAIETTAAHRPATEEDHFAGLERTASPSTNGHARNGKPSGSYGRPMSPERERTITRLSLISSAAAFFAGREDATEVDVLEAAMRWEAWASGTA